MGASGPPMPNHTALVRSSGCFSGHDYLSDPCGHCGRPLYGRIIIQSGLPGQNLLDFTDIDDPGFDPSRNLARSLAYFTGCDFLPSSSINWAAVCAPAAHLGTPRQEVEEVAQEDCINVPDVFHDASAFLDDDTYDVSDDVVIAVAPDTSCLSSLPSWSWYFALVLGSWCYTALCLSLHSIAKRYNLVLLGSIRVLSWISVSLHPRNGILGHNESALNLLTDFLDKKIEDLNKKVDNIMKKIREEVQDNVQNRSQGIPGLSTIMKSSSSESNRAEQVSKDIDGSVIDLSLNLCWSSRYLNTKDTAFSKAIRSRSQSLMRRSLSKSIFI
jgi:hypothetical protein